LETKIGMFGYFLWKGLQKFEYTRLGPLVFPEGLVIHKEVYHLPFPRKLVQPMGEFVRHKRIFTPVGVRKPESNVIRKTVIFQE